MENASLHFPSRHLDPFSFTLLIAIFPSLIYPCNFITILLRFNLGILRILFSFLVVPSSCLACTFLGCHSLQALQIVTIDFSSLLPFFAAFVGCPHSPKKYVSEVLLTNRVDRAGEKKEGRERRKQTFDSGVLRSHFVPQLLAKFRGVCSFSLHWKRNFESKFAWRALARI